MCTALQLLEAFGHRKLMLNNNSTRFVKQLKLQFDDKFSLVGGHVKYYLLRKSDMFILNRDFVEARSFHIFYMLLAGAPEDVRVKLRLSNPDDFEVIWSAYSTKCTFDRIV